MIKKNNTDNVRKVQKILRFTLLNYISLLQTYSTYNLPVHSQSSFIKLEFFPQKYLTGEFL